LPAAPHHAPAAFFGLSVAPLLRSASLSYPVQGVLAAHIALHGTQAAVFGQGSVALTQASGWGQPIENLTAQLQGAGKIVHATFEVVTPAGAASGALSYDFGQQAYTAQLHVPGLQLERLQVVRDRTRKVSGVATASVEGQGTLRNPQFTATVTMPRLLIGGQHLDGLTLHAGVTHQQASFTMQSAVLGSSLEAQGAIALGSDYSCQATLDARNLQLGSLLAALLPRLPPQLRGQAELHGSLYGPLKRWRELEGEVEVPAINLSYQNLRIANASPLRAVYRGGVISLESCELKEPIPTCRATRPLYWRRAASRPRRRVSSTFGSFS
jgi:hypothetical protein